MLRLFLRQCPMWLFLAVWGEVLYNGKENTEKEAKV